MRPDAYGGYLRTYKRWKKMKKKRRFDYILGKSGADFDPFRVPA